MVAVAMGTANRLLIRSVSLVSGLTRTCSRSLTHAVMRGPYWTGVVTPVRKIAPVTVPQALQKQRWARCSVTSRECLNKSVFSGIRVSWPVDETPEPIGDVLSRQEMGILMPEPTVPAALRRLRTDSPHVRRWRRAPR